MWRPLRSIERELIDKRLATVASILPPVSDSDDHPFSISRLDDSFAAWRIDRDLTQIESVATLDAFGIAYGQFIADTHNMRWVAIATTNKNSWRSGMAGSEIKPGERVKDVHFGDDTFSVDLVDGRTITVPYAWYPRLLHASPEHRAKWTLCGGGFGIHWPDLDEDLSTEGLLRGAPAPRAAEPATGRPT